MEGWWVGPTAPGWLSAAHHTLADRCAPHDPDAIEVAQQGPVAVLEAVEREGERGVVRCVVDRLILQVYILRNE